MPANYVLLETIQLNQSAASVTFNNIPQTGYTDLKIVLSARSTANGGQNVNLRFNSSASGYSDRILNGSGSGSGSSFNSGNTTYGSSCVIPGADFTGSTFGNGEIYIPNAFASTAKSFLSDSATENNTTLSYLQMHATSWTGTTSISQVDLTISGGSFVIGSTFSIYGVAAFGTTPEIAPLATGGNIVAQDGTYWYHAFLSSGTFTPAKALSCDMLVIAGGGGGLTGGGGAGGLLAHTSQSLANGTGYTCTIGAGGASYVNGTNSTFQGLTAAVGGGRGGGNSTTNPPGSGGSGGGSMGLTSGSLGAFAGGTGTINQGNNGGSGFWGNAYAGGGGGGASAVGGNSGTTSGAGQANGGSGGSGSSAYSSWASATSTGVSGVYAGGGGGSANLAGTTGHSAGGGGSGGGGAGTTSGTGTAAITNTGSGGGGGVNTGGVGASGIVIVRYLMSS